MRICVQLARTCLEAVYHCKCSEDSGELSPPFFCCNEMPAAGAACATKYLDRTFSEKESLNSIFICRAPTKPTKDSMPIMANMM